MLFLRILVYDSPEAVEFGFKEWEDVFAKRVTDLNVLFDTVYSEVDAVVDLPHSYFFDTFLERWPDAKVMCTKNVRLTVVFLIQRFPKID